MKKFMHIGLLTLGLAGFSFPGGAAEQKIATFNLRKAFDSYYKTIQSKVALRQEGAEVEKERAQMVENARKHEDQWRKLIDNANDQATSADEREKNKQAATQKYAELKSDEQSIKAFEREATSRFEEKNKLRQEDIVKEIVNVLSAHAKADGYSMVFDSSGDSVNMVPVLIYTDGRNDLTDGIIKELNAAAPPGSLDTNTLVPPPSINLTNTFSPPK